MKGLTVSVKPFSLFVLLIAVIAGCGAAEIFKDTIEITYASKATPFTNIIHIQRTVGQQPAGLIETEHIDKGFEVHTKAPVEQKGKIMILII